MLDNTQVIVLRSQFERLAKQGDKALVAFVEENRAIMEDDQVSDLADKAAEAYDRLKTKKVEETIEQVEVQEKADKASSKTEDQANRERRGKIAAIFSSKGYDEAAVAIEQELEGADPKTLDRIVAVLSPTKTQLRKAQKIGDESVIEGGAIVAAGLYGWANHWAYDHRNNALKALNLMAEITAIKLFVWLTTLVSKALRAVESAKNAWSDKFRDGLVRQARQHLEEANVIRFQGWALSALERLMNGSNNPVFEALRNDPELAGTVGVAPDGRRAVALLDAMKNRVENRLASFHVGPMRSGKTERDHANRGGAEAIENQRRIRQLERAKECKAMKGHNPGVEKRGKGSKK
jgi:hypothetical protein